MKFEPGRAPWYVERVRTIAVVLSAVLFGCGGQQGGVCPAPLSGQVELAALEAHLLALADIGDAHGGTRAAATPGHEASADYVAERLAAAGLAVHRQEFQFADYELLAPAEFEQVEPEPASYGFGEDFRVAAFSGDGAVQGPVVAIDLALGPGNKSTSGCEPEDFAGFFPGSIALIQRGTCYHVDKVAQAVRAGASAVVFFNQGDTEARSGLYTPRLDEDTTIPVVGVSHALGVALSERAPEGLVLRIAVEGQEVTRTTENVIAETPPTGSGAVIMLGAHLDSVVTGPGINDDGSGSAAVLEVLAGMARCEPRHQIRAAFWGAEELGLIGSTHYVGSLGDAERAAIAMYVNLDMIASPNPVRLIYDGDGSAFGREGPAGSGDIEAAFAEYFAGEGLPTAETAFDGRSDYWAFIQSGIPAGGLFTGAEGAKSTAEVGVFGGEANLAYDPCYHAACDDRDNYDPAVFLENARASAHVIELYAGKDLPFF